MDNATLVELVPERGLLDPNFAGYKLSLDPIPLYVGNSSSKVDHVLRSEEQYSLQHVKLFGLHNHLFCDPWSLNDVYFVDEKWMVQRNVLNQETGRLTSLAKVWEIPSNHMRRPGHYNPSAGFPDLDLVLFSDGAGTLHLVKSGDRQKARNPMDDGNEWKVLMSEEVCGPEVPFVLIHSLVEAGELNDSGSAVCGRRVHCLLLHVEEAKNVKGTRIPPSNEMHGPTKTSRTTAFVTIIEWVTLHEGKDGSWSVGRIRKLCGSAIPDYAVIEAGGVGVVLGSEQPFVFIEDTEKPLVLDEEMKEAKGDVAAEECTEIDWQQDAEEVTLTIPVSSLEENINLSEISVSVIDGKKVCIKYSDSTVLEGVMLHLLDHDLTTWEVNNGKLKVCFHKLQEGQMWNTLFAEGGPKCQEEIDPKLSEEIHNRLSHLTSESLDPAVGSVPVFNSEELEECDENPFNAASLCRFDGETHVATHKASISTNQWLFNVHMSPGVTPAICLRHGPDGLLWQPVNSCNPQTKEVPSSDIPKDWRCSHVASFVSFGYVQASNQRKKFIACSPDASYVAVCEASQYVYIYRQPAHLAGNAQLRNRRTGEQINRVARQNLISLPTSQEILGVHASVTTLYLLMEDKLLAYMVNQ